MFQPAALFVFTLAVATLTCVSITAAATGGNGTVWRTPLNSAADQVHFVVGMNADDQCGSVAVLVITSTEAIAYNANGQRLYRHQYPGDQTIPSPAQRPVFMKGRVAVLIPAFGVVFFDCATGVSKITHADNGIQSNLAAYPAQGWVCYGTRFFQTSNAAINCISPTSSTAVWYSGQLSSVWVPAVAVTEGGCVISVEVNEDGSTVAVGRSTNTVGRHELFRTELPPSLPRTLVSMAFSTETNTAVFGTGEVPQGSNPWILGVQDEGNNTWTWVGSALSELTPVGTAVVGMYAAYGAYYAYNASTGMELWFSGGCLSATCPPPTGRCGVAVVSGTGTDVLQLSTASGNTLADSDLGQQIAVLGAGAAGVFAVTAASSSSGYLAMVQGAWLC